MLNNWVEFLTKVRSAGRILAGANPPVVAAYRGLNEAQAGGKVLDAKTRELISLAVAVTTRCDGCIASHVEAARKAGVTQEELGEALGTAIALNAGAAYIYSARAMEAFEQFSRQ
ncbi:hypothetical protein CAL29_06100 [Bordetella genomosp. 10]|uniref:Carboxymuconolactone decarboxylase-like domain-containing protein n=1 Tax=Bordetella genomosp. 10 TaxID=1416804 RepID=A0A261SNP3_9BORD|nr:carboxymuconolactone decarboxylase family protein [Bordetella genomosp. 10]OZI37933.1 hypothetical protein CAL29_06100 [Bordetella genomosp. 10]